MRSQIHRLHQMCINSGEIQYPVGGRGSAVNKSVIAAGSNTVLGPAIASAGENIRDKFRVARAFCTGHFVCFRSSVD